MQKKKENVKPLKYKDTSQIPIPNRIVDQVVGQERAIQLIKKAAQQKRHIMLVGEPGTGKSMIASALAEILPPYKLKDVLSYPNSEDSHNPHIRTVPAGH